MPCEAKHVFSTSPDSRKKEKDFPNVFFNRFIVKSPDQLPYRAGSEF